MQKSYSPDSHIVNLAIRPCSGDQVEFRGCTADSKSMRKVYGMTQHAYNQPTQDRESTSSWSRSRGSAGDWVPFSVICMHVCVLGLNTPCVATLVPIALDAAGRILRVKLEVVRALNSDHVATSSCLGAKKRLSVTRSCSTCKMTTDQYG